jgi:hypothetical protein
MELEPVLNQLTEQVTSLTRQVAELQQQVSVFQAFLRTETREGSPMSPLHVRCASLTVCSPENPGRAQAVLAAGSAGPTFTFSGSDGSARMLIEVQEEQVRCSLYGAENQPAVELGAEAGAERGYMAVFDGGKPRALIKASEAGGAVSIVHDDGRPRAMLFGNATHGEVLALGAETEATVKLSCDKAHGGGLITVSGNDAKPAVALSASAEGGAVMVLRKEGTVGCSLATMERVAGITIADLGQGQIHLLSDSSGPSIRLTGPDGRPRLSLHSTAEGAIISLDSLTEQPLLSLATLQGQPALHLENGKGDRVTLQTAPEGGAMLAFANPPDKPQLLLLNSKSGPSVALRPQADRGAAATLGCTKEGGAIFICDSDGTRRCGLCATEDGSQLMLFNDLGIERVLLGSAQDGGALKLNWGGTMGVAALATQDGGAVVVNDANGQPRASLPPHEG